MWSLMSNSSSTGTKKPTAAEDMQDSDSDDDEDETSSSEESDTGDSYHEYVNLHCHI